MCEKVKISVAMTTYNGIKYIDQQIKSILVQLNEDAEVIVGDDGSTDGTLEYLNELSMNDTRVKVISQNHLGVNKNIESILKMCKGDIIFISDQDDVWENNKVQVICNYFAQNSEIDLIFHNSRVSSSVITEITHDNLFDYLKPSDKFSKNVMKYRFWGCMFAVRRRLIEYTTPFKFAFDNWIYFCATYLKKALVVDDILMTYRRHGNNVSSFKTHSFVRNVFVHSYKLVKFYLNLPRIKKKFKRVNK